MPRKNKHVVVEATASTTEGNTAFSVHWVTYLINDGTVDITFNFDGDTTQSDAFTIKPGECLNEFERECTRIYYKTASGTAAFRALGLARA